MTFTIELIGPTLYKRSPQLDAIKAFCSPGTRYKQLPWSKNSCHHLCKRWEPSALLGFMLS